MELSELAAYAAERYQMQEEHKWADFPGFSVLCHPRSGKWLALLMRQWDWEAGQEIERCDLKCGQDVLELYAKPYLAPPIRMRGKNWISVAFDTRTEQEVVFRLFDQAVSGGEHGYTLVLPPPRRTEGDFQDTALPLRPDPSGPGADPERLREMRRLYTYGRESGQARAKNFYRQAVFMRDYEDDYPWSGEFARYFPTYHDLTTRQLRGYFSWRTQARRGNYQPIPVSAAYLYVYELLNGVGADGPEDSLAKLRDFEAGFLEAGFGNEQMRANLRRWRLEYAVVQNLPPELARQAVDPEILAQDAALAALRAPEGCTDEALFDALCRLEGKRLADSPVLKRDSARGMRLFSAVWRGASAYVWQGKPLFSLCFGAPKLRQWYPLANAVYYERERPTDREYHLNECRSYVQWHGFWYALAYEKQPHGLDRFRGLLHEADARLRRYLKTGRYLRERGADAWAGVYIDAAIEADRQALLEAARPKVRIDLSGLAQIRRDAALTRESLLTEEERAEVRDIAPPPESESPLVKSPEPELSPAGPLDAVQTRLLLTLLRGGDPAELLRANHLMPSILADQVNEALFDEIGDSVLLCQEDRLSLVEDYRADIERLVRAREGHSDT